MWSAAFIFSTLFGVSVAFDSMCSPKKCDERFPNVSLSNKDNIFPNAGRLEAMCPSFLNYIDCVFSEIDICLGGDINEMVNSENRTIAAMANMFLGISNLYRELCNESTSFHKDYVSNVDCLRNIALQPTAQSLCALEAVSLYTGYKYTVENQDDQQACMISAYVVACVSAEVMNECGEGARALLIDLLKRTQLMKYHICSEQDLKDLKTSFLDYLELRGDQRLIFEKAFDLKKRR